MELDLIIESGSVNSGVLRNQDLAADHLIIIDIDSPVFDDLRVDIFNQVI